MQRRKGPVDRAHYPQRTWPPGSDGKQCPHPFASLPMSSHFSERGVTVTRTGKKRSYCFFGDNGGRREPAADFSSLPFDVLRKIAASFSVTNLWAASGVCRPWFLSGGGSDSSMAPVVFARNVPKALDSFLKAASRGCAAAMADAGLNYWEMVPFNSKGR